MERSVIRGRGHGLVVPDYASLHPGYALDENLDDYDSRPYDRAMIQIATNANARRRRIIAAGAGVCV